METNLKKKVVLVTGGSRGIGKAICRAFAAEGSLVAINYLQNKQMAEDLVKEIESSYGTDAIAVGANMSKEHDIIAMINQVEETLGSIDVLVNNAAYCPSGPITSYSVEEWEKTFAINVTGMFVGSREMVKRWLLNEKKACIVNIASQAAFRGSTTGHYLTTVVKVQWFHSLLVWLVKLQNKVFE